MEIKYLIREFDDRHRYSDGRVQEPWSDRVGTFNKSKIWHFQWGIKSIQIRRCYMSL